MSEISTSDPSVSLTRNQHLVYQCLCNAARPMSAYSLLDKLKPEGLNAPLQIYRSLEKLLNVGLVHKLESMNTFMACQHPVNHAHLAGFAICDMCKKVEEFHHTETEKALDNWAHKDQFSVRRAAIELHGRCSDCQDDDDEAGRADLL